MKGSNDERRFSQLMKGLAGVFDVKGTLTPVKIELYFKALEDLTIDEIERAVGLLIRDREYTTLPLPAHIRKIIQPKLLHDSTAAWLVVLNGLEKNEVPKDPVIQKTIASMGGFEQLSLVTYDKLTWTQKEFERRYELFDAKRILYELPDPRKDNLKIVEINPKKKEGT